MVKNKRENQKIYELSYLSIMFLMIASSFLGLTSFLMFQQLKQNTFFACVIGFCVGFLFLFSFIKIKKMAKEKDIIDYNIQVFGKFFGNVVNIVLNLSIFFVACVFFENIIMFVNTNYLMETALSYIKILLLCVVAYTSSKKIFAIMRAGNVIIVLNVLFFILSIIGIFPKFRIERIYPILNCDIRSLISSSLIYAVCGMFTMFLLTIIPNSKVHKDNENTKKVFITYILANIFIIVIILCTIMTLGENLLEIFKYPEYLTLQEFSLFSIIERVENTLSLQFILNTFVTLTVMVYFIYISINKFVRYIYNRQGKEYKESYEAIISYIVCILILIFTNNFFKSSVLFTEQLKKYYFYIILFGIIAPMIITLICAIIKEKINQFNSNVLQKQK